MAYTLTLTKAERAAFDWVGDRYAAGAIATILARCCTGYKSWDDEGDVDFVVQEHMAWEIHTLAEEEECEWPCFAPSLASKMSEFLMRIV